MWSWQRLAIGIVAIGATAQVLAQDTAQPERRAEAPAALLHLPPAAPQTAPPISTAAVAVAAANNPGLTGESGSSASPPARPADTIPQADVTRAQADRAPERPEWVRDAGPRAAGDRSRPRYVQDRSRYRARYSGADWPLGQSRRFEGPRDAYGGRWIYLRPSRQASARYDGRYGARVVQHDQQRRYSPQRPSYRSDPYARQDQRLYGPPSRRYD